MTTTSRQNNLILNQDWTRIYQTFRNADFKSYDFENLRRVIITYLRENYPEDFNDYIESSEYMALIDAVAFLGQSLAFRIDLASRENFIELAETKESVLRIARMLSYNAKRTAAASGLLKFTTVSTTDNIIDSNGKDLAQQLITWNDPTNPNWLEQFLTVLNSAMADNTEFGRSQGSAVIQGIPTEQYRFRTTTTDVPLFSFTKTVASRGISFEIVSTAFKNSENIYEEPPVPGNQLGFIYKNDGAGPASINTGFFLLFKQGTLELADFAIEVPTTNEKIAVDAGNINNDDVWLFSLNSQGAQLEEWTKVSSLVGNNIAYNSITQNIRNIYAINTKENDNIDLVFADGVYGNLPQGAFRVFYRTSNGLTYTIYPNELRGINISVVYLNKNNVEHTLTIGLALQTTVANSAASEDIDNIRANAPAVYYTQNRMITAEDYNLAPLLGSQNIIKIKSVNRTSSGISRNFDIIDATGKYSSINVFGSDGYIYKQEDESLLGFRFTNRIDIINFIRRSLEPVFAEDEVYNFYFSKFDKILFTDTNTVWQSVSTTVSTGFFKNVVDNAQLRVGTFSTSSLKYALVDAAIKFVAPAGFRFKKGKIVTADDNDAEQTQYIWAKIVKVTGDGSYVKGLGPITLSEVIPTGAIAQRILPRFVTDLPIALETEIVNQVFENQNFGLRYEVTESQWRLITASNLNLTNDFTLGKSGDTTNTNADSSWIVAFVKEPDSYTVRVRKQSYIFGSINQNRFYFDSNEKGYNDQIGIVVKDQVSVLGINPGKDFITELKRDIAFEVSDTIKFEDGYESTSEIKLSFRDSDDDGVIDDPESFENIVGLDTDLNFLFFESSNDIYGTRVNTLLDNSTDLILIRDKEGAIDFNDTVTYPDQQLIYFYDVAENIIKRVNRSTNTLDIANEYSAAVGRRNLKFQYIHNASVDRRIDPSSSNIIDIYLLIRSYDESFRIFLAGGTDVEPVAPTSESLRTTFGSALAPIKSISDDIIYHPVKYKVLFGSKAEPALQAVFKIVKNQNRSINDNDLKVRVITAINNFFSINNWDFGDRFYMGELTTYILNTVVPDLANIVIVPRQSNQAFGSLFEIQSSPDEILISAATVDDIEIVSAITAAEIGIRTNNGNDNGSSNNGTEPTTFRSVAGTSSSSSSGIGSSSSPSGSSGTTIGSGGYN
jgi:hypothetical protein